MKNLILALLMIGASSVSIARVDGPFVSGGMGERIQCHDQQSENIAAISFNTTGGGGMIKTTTGQINVSCDLKNSPIATAPSTVLYVQCQSANSDSISLQIYKNIQTHKLSGILVRLNQNGVPFPQTLICEH